MELGVHLVVQFDMSPEVGEVLGRKRRTRSGFRIAALDAGLWLGCVDPLSRPRRVSPEGGMSMQGAKVPQ